LAWRNEKIVLGPRSDLKLEIMIQWNIDFNFQELRGGQKFHFLGASNKASKISTSSINGM